MRALIVNNETLATMYARLSYCPFAGITVILFTSLLPLSSAAKYELPDRLRAQSANIKAVVRVQGTCTEKPFPTP